LQKCIPQLISPLKDHSKVRKKGQSSPSKILLRKKWVWAQVGWGDEDFIKIINLKTFFRAGN